MNDEITQEQDETTLEQGGFDAISEKLHALYPGQEGRFYGTVIPYFLAGMTRWTEWRSGRAKRESPTGTM